MNTNNKNTIIILIIGLMIGYFINPMISQNFSKNTDQKYNPNTHMMPDGTAMNDKDMNMHNMMDMMMSSLEGKTGDDFDRAFLQEMIIHHEGAVVMAREVLKVSNRDELKNLSNEIIEAQEKEIQMMKNWLSEWFD
jgi:uncharacterized protein (DUF305 family)